MNTQISEREHILTALNSEIWSQLDVSKGFEKELARSEEY